MLITAAPENEHVAIYRHACLDTIKMGDERNIGSIDTGLLSLRASGEPLRTWYRFHKRRQFSWISELPYEKSGPQQLPEFPGNEPDGSRRHLLSQKRSPGDHTWDAACVSLRVPQR
jgi:hypothetical protein